MSSNYTMNDLLNKVEDFHSLPQSDQVKLMAFFYSVVNNMESFTPGQIRLAFANNDLEVPSNVSHNFAQLMRTKPAVFIRKKDHYSFQRDVRKGLAEVYLSSKHRQHVSNTLRSLLPKVTSKEQNDFLEEAVTCFETSCYRAAVVMTWLLTMDVLFEHTLKRDLIAFNNAIQADGQYRKITIAIKEDFSELKKESDIIKLLKSAGIITNDVRKILDNHLGFRNTMAHPNTVVIKESRCAAMIEDLVENVITKFS